MAAALGFAQQQPDLTEDYAGTLAPYHVKLHLNTARDGTLTGTVDSPDAGLMGMQCTDIHVNGQTLSFTVPVVHGTWIGFISGNGASLSGTWSQGSPMPLNFTRIATTGTATSTAPASQAGPGEVKWDDYIFKFNPSGTMAQVFEGGKVVGTILTMNGEQQVIPLPGTDADKLKKSFDDYKAFSARSHSQNGSPAVTTAMPPLAPQAGSVPAAAPPPAPAGGSATNASAIRFDEATHTITVPRPDGVTVTFVGQDVKIAGYRRLSYILRHQKGGPGRFLERNLGHANAEGGEPIGRRRGISEGRRRTDLRFGHGHL